MIKRTILLGMMIFCVQTAFAQDSSLNIAVRSSGRSDSEMVLNFKSGRDLKTGFFIELPEGMSSAIKSVNVAGKKLWLKESNASPAGKNLLHWQKTSAGYAIRLSADNLAAGILIQIILQTPLSMTRMENQRIVFMEINVRNNGAIEKTAEIAANRIPKSND